MKARTPQRLTFVLALSIAACAPSEGSSDAGVSALVSGMAVGKFCHQLTHGGQPRTLTLEVGSNFQFATFQAVTNTCQPAVNQPCTPVPVGLVEVRIKEGDVVLVTREVVLSDGEEYLFEPRVNATDGSLGVSGGPLQRGSCMALDLMHLDAGTMSGTDD